MIAFNPPPFFLIFGQFGRFPIFHKTMMLFVVFLFDTLRQFSRYLNEFRNPEDGEDDVLVDLFMEDEMRVFKWRSIMDVVSESFIGR